MHTIDCKGLSCPQPVINTKKYFDSIEGGEATIIVDNEVAKNNISRFAENSGYSFTVEMKNEFYEIKVVKNNSIKDNINASKGKYTMVVGSDKLGGGAEELGDVLMKSFMYALTESNLLPDTLLFLNSGIKLTIKDSPVLESLKTLQQKGVYIASCGTCLDYYKVKDKLALGEITNMYTIIEKINEADKVLKL